MRGASARLRGRAGYLDAGYSLPIALQKAGYDRPLRFRKHLGTDTTACPAVPQMVRRGRTVGVRVSANI
jgi:hypothetical protein